MPRSARMAALHSGSVKPSTRPAACSSADSSLHSLRLAIGGARERARGRGRENLPLPGGSQEECASGGLHTEPTPTLLRAGAQPRPAAHRLLPPPAPSQHALLLLPAPHRLLPPPAPRPPPSGSWLPLLGPSSTVYTLSTVGNNTGKLYRNFINNLPPVASLPTFLP